MQKTFLWILCFALIVGGAFAGGKAWREQRNRNTADSQDLDYGFQPAAFPLENRSFVFFICGYNNGAFIEKTLRTVFAQAYDSYRLIYIDDASTDGSFEAARDAIYASGQMLRTTIARNEERLGQLANLVRAVDTCEDQEIVVVLNGEDWLAHEWVLCRLNQYYADSDLWLTYGQYCEFPSYKAGSARSYRKNKWSELREAPFTAGHLKTFYAGLFRKVSKTDHTQHGADFPAAFDLAVMLPMLEMAGGHFQFLPEILYIANRHAAVQIDPEMHARCEKEIRSFKPYQPLASFSFSTDDAIGDVL
jgi:hypothetical protein